MANSTVCQSKWKPIVEPRRAKPKTYRQAPSHWSRRWILSTCGDARSNLFRRNDLFRSNTFGVIFNTDMEKNAAQSLWKTNQHSCRSENNLPELRQVNVVRYMAFVDYCQISVYYCHFALNNKTVLLKRWLWLIHLVDFSFLLQARKLLWYPICFPVH